MIKSPVGILDSGIGGLTIWKEIITLLPHESTLYIADSSNCPYGEKSVEFVLERARRMVRFLLENNAKLIVIACNTVTVIGIDRLREEFPGIPIAGIVPVIKTAAELSQKKKIGILSTTLTAESAYQKDLIQKFGNGCRVINVGTNELVPCIENGEIDPQEIGEKIRGELNIFKKEGIDTLALGCSHYPFIKEIIQKELGSTVHILDSGKAVARQVQRILEKEGRLEKVNSPYYEFVTSGKSEILEKMAHHISGRGKMQAKPIVF